MVINEKQLLDLLEQCVPYLKFCVGGTDVEETLGAVAFVLQAAGRTVPEMDEAQEAAHAFGSNF
jgi:hypothetical protein